MPAFSLSIFLKPVFGMRSECVSYMFIQVYFQPTLSEGRLGAVSNSYLQVVGHRYRGRVSVYTDNMPSVAPALCPARQGRARCRRQPASGNTSVPRCPPAAILQAQIA
ncbi:hypothetical protein LSAT2_020662 [Lamellibrachia satsuma]|nr:hypothetical protein LSAT2_020662 [Lamellibrachia satsuma]